MNVLPLRSPRRHGHWMALLALVLITCSIGISLLPLAAFAREQAVNAVVNVSILNVRSGPGPSYNILGRIAKGDEYQVTGRDAGRTWVQLALPQFPEGKGWVYAPFVLVSAPLEELPVVAGPAPSRPATAQVAPSLSGKIALPIFDGSRGTYDIYLVDVGRAAQPGAGSGGLGLRKVVEQASQPALSPDGQWLAFRHWRVDDRGIVVTDTEGQNALRVTDFLEDGLPSWSPDSTKLVFSSFREVDRIPRLYWLWADRKVEWQILQGPYAVYGADPVWMPDDTILYRVTRYGDGFAVTTRAGWAVTRVLSDESARSPAVSPDGGQIAYMAWRDNNWEVFRANSDGSNIVQLTRHADADGLPAWSPDGSHLAFVSNRGGSWALWVMRADGREQRQLLVLPGSIDGRVRGEPDYLTGGWLEEQISWSR